MLYLTEPAEIRSAIAQLSQRDILWLDTETADWHTPKPHLSLIQVAIDDSDLTGDSVQILDVLNQPELTEQFIVRVMENQQIEKVFHNASYDLKFLGGSRAKNVTCTLKISKRLALNVLGTPNRKLKTLAAQLCGFQEVDEVSGQSDWTQRPLNKTQLHYAKMDVVYLARVHQRLLELSGQKISFSATQTRLALECPRLFYLDYHYGGKTVFVPRDRLKGSGPIFHQLAFAFVKQAKQDPDFSTLFKLPADRLEQESVAQQIQQYFYAHCFYPYLLEKTRDRPDRAALLLEIWNGLVRLISHWAELLIKNRRSCSPEKLVHRTFIAEEYPLEQTFTLPNGKTQKVVGKLDALLCDIEQKRYCVVDYKTYEPADLSAQLAQVALYSTLVRAKKPIPVDAAIYCVLPTFKEYRYTWEQLQETVNQLIPHKLQQMTEWIIWQQGAPQPPPPTPQPHLCEICPQQAKCQSGFPDAPPIGVHSGEKIEIPQLLPPPAPEPSMPSTTQVKVESAVDKETPTPSEADAVARELVDVLASFKLNVEYLGAIVGSTFTRVKLKPGLGVKVSSLLKLSDDLQVQLGISAPPMIAAQPGYVSIDLPRNPRQALHFENYLQPQTQPAGVPSHIAIGVDLEGKLVEANLSDPNTCHFLVGGTTGSGKSEFLRSLLLSLLYRHSPEHLQIALVDPKRVTFPEFDGMPWLHSPTVKQSDRAIALMEELVAEMERRYQSFERARCPHLEAYNRLKTPLPRIVCIFDEYADFMADKDTRTALETHIKRLGSMARAAGIHLIIATQRPEAGVVTPIIRSNLPGRVALRTASEADSAIILGGKQSEAAYLLGKGDLLYSGGAQIQRLQSLFAARFQLPNVAP